ncbi:MAG TPA: hypothetical protein PLF13_14040 [candidate division Zixibacteria bacterium]|nr:hypothetical protein [candidate division Zixibacteria bacterium]
MRILHKSYVTVSLTVAIMVAVVLGLRYCRTSEQETALLSLINQLPDADKAHHFLIYVDTNSCLACTEDMASWVELEERLPDCNCSFSLWAPACDSFDVAYTMKLEGLHSPVRVIGEDLVREIQRRGLRTPIRLLLDSVGGPISIKSAMVNKPESTRYARNILKALCNRP